MKILRTFAIIIYVAVSIVQMVAIITGVTYTLGFWGILLGVILGPMPLIGMIMGIIGATKVWGWSVLASISLFGGPLILGVVTAFIRHED